jgi:hypothetical protein
MSAPSDNAPANVPTANRVMVPLDRIPTDQGGQTRVHVHAGAVRDYAAAMTAQLADGGLQFPPVVLFTDGRDYWLADGFHRVLAARKAGLAEIAAQVHPGTQRDVLLFAVSANGAHGLPRTRADMRKLVGLLLADVEWSQWSDREIARRCRVDHKVVSRLRRRACGAQPHMPDRKVRRGGTVYQMDVNSRGAAEQPAPDAAAVPVPATDPAGIPVPEPQVKIFAALVDFTEADRLFGELAALLDRIARGPAGELYRQEMIWAGPDKGFACAALGACRRKLAGAAPYCSYCPVCDGKPQRLRAECKKCRGRGWTTRAAFESCLHVERQHVLLHR